MYQISKQGIWVHANCHCCWSIYGGFLKWWYPTTMGFPAKSDHVGVEIGGTTI